MSIVDRTPRLGRPGRPRDTAGRSRRRQAILDSATIVFAERGYVDAEMQAIADHLNVGKGTLYRHFMTKESLFLAVVDAAMVRLRQQIDEAADESSAPLDQIASGVRAYLSFFRNHPEVVELLIQERAHFRDRKQSTYFLHQDQAMNRWEALYLQLIKDGIVRPVPVESILEVISNVLYGSMFANHLSRASNSLEEQCGGVLDILFFGLLTTDGEVAA